MNGFRNTPPQPEAAPRGLSRRAVMSRTAQLPRVRSDLTSVDDLARGFTAAGLLSCEPIGEDVGGWLHQSASSPMRSRVRVVPVMNRSLIDSAAVVSPAAAVFS